MRKYISRETKVNEIKMLLLHPSFKGKTVVILEGNTDIRLFRSLLCRDCLSESVDGKNNVEDVIKDLNSVGIDKVLGVADADFDNMLGLKPSINSVFLTDYHDIEVMLLSSPALYSVIAEYALNQVIFERLDAELFASITSIGFKIGVLRLINYKNDLNLNFKGLHYELFCKIDDLNISIDIDKLLNILCRRSANLKTGENEKTIKKLYEKYIQEDHELLQVCSGHDLTKLISIIFRQVSMSNNCNTNQDKIEMGLRLAYTIETFKQTKLYKSLFAWQKTAKAMIVEG